MKKFKQLLCLALALTISASLLAACGQKNNGGSKDSDEKVLTYAVEGGSAGEEIALEKGWKVTTLEDQAAALMEVAAGTSDAAVIDLLMAGAYQDGTTQTLARQFGIREDLLAEMPQTGYTEDAGGDVAYIRGKGTLVVGITEFAPMDYKDDNGQWTGFDAELARLVAQRLGMDVEFVIIEWGQKVNELNSRAIDVVWNGMTLTDGVQNAMTCTPAYCRNAQVVVVPAA